MEIRRVRQIRHAMLRRKTAKGRQFMSDNAAPAGVFINHLGQTVTDIARSRRVYEGLLGFKFWWDFAVPDHLAAKVLMLPPPCGLTATYLWRPDLTLELMHFGAPAAREAFVKRRLNQPGLTHLALSVTDAPALLA